MVIRDKFLKIDIEFLIKQLRKYVISTMSVVAFGKIEQREKEAQERYIQAVKHLQLKIKKHEKILEVIIDNPAYYNKKKYLIEHRKLKSDI